MSGLLLSTPMTHLTQRKARHDFSSQPFKDTDKTVRTCSRETDCLLSVICFTDYAVLKYKHSDDVLR